jgi:4-amino-4-deoxy-L-arabinose transferase-like glycosyltransferase
MEARWAVGGKRCVGWGRAVHVAAVAALLVCGTLVRAVNLGGLSFSFDEFFQVFAARAWLENGTLVLPSGEPYTRARLATYLTAAAFALFGEGEAQARLPTVALGIASMALVYVAGRVLFGPTAGLVALTLLAFSPDAIDVDRFVRPYSPLTFFYLLAAVAAFRFLGALERDESPLGRPGAAWVTVGVVSGLLALHFHPAAVALVLIIQAYAGVAVIAFSIRARASNDPEERRTLRGVAVRYEVLVGLMLLVETIVMAFPALRVPLVKAALEPLPWYQGGPGDSMHYHYHLTARYAWLWFLVGPATLLVGLARWRAGLFAGLAFWLPFVLMSAVVATKQPRYVAHLLPFAWLILGGATEVVLPHASAALGRQLGRLLPGWVPRRAAAWALLVLALAPALRFSPSLVSAVRRPQQTTGMLTTGYFGDWRGLRRMLEGRLEPDAPVVSTVPLAVAYYLEQPAYHLIGPQRSQAGGHPAEHWERRYNLSQRRVRHAEQLALLRRQGTTVWVVVEPWRWGTPGKFDAGLQRAVTAECKPLDRTESLVLAVLACPPIADRGAGSWGGAAPSPTPRAEAARGQPLPSGSATGSMSP